MAQQRIGDSRRSHALGTIIVIVGCLGFATSVTLGVWALHDLSNSKAFADGAVATVNKIDVVAVVGLTPALISCLIIAAGIFLRTKALELLATVPDRVEASDGYEPLPGAVPEARPDGPPSPEVTP